MKILVVDDSETIRYLLHVYFNKQGYQVFFARHGAEGLDVARIQKPDFILSDILMPVMDGFRFLSALREDESIRHIPFIFFSGTYTDEDAMKLGFALGADGFVLKSQDFNNFTDELEKMFKEISFVKEKSKPKLAASENEFLEKYVEIMAVKLEKKVQELEESNRKINEMIMSYEYLFNSIRDVIVVTDNEQCITKVNMPIFRETFGYNDDEIRGKDIKVLFDVYDDYEFIKQGVFEKKDYITGKTVVTNFKKRDGSVFKGDVKAMKLIGEFGMITGNICMIRILK